MATLNIAKFSCLKDASFTLAPLSVIIGPQGSGKSVTTKLFYFFSDMLSNYMQYAERGDSIDDYKKIIAKQFNTWFPPSAWGQQRFNIGYSTGKFSVRLLRRRSQGRLLDEVTVTFSEWFSGFYSRACETFAQSEEKGDIDFDSNIRVSDTLDRMWQVRDVLARKMMSEMEGDYFSQQTFIPAGRAFFTSIGRLVAGFEQAGSLDPVTVKFARLLVNIKDRLVRRIPLRLNRLGDDFMTRRNGFMNKLFGGDIKFENDTEFVETPDGRKVPFSSLSSGQQELLPMWSLLDYFNEIDAIRSLNAPRLRRNSREVVYIEEPEAHLFPSAQSILMEFLIGSVVSERNKRSLVITTHSPYIMSKLNVFLKAGQLARRKKRNQEIGAIVPRECWLNERQLAAFAIEDGQLRSLVDEDGLIDGGYLDSVSEDIAREFSALLKIEMEI